MYVVVADPLGGFGGVGVENGGRPGSLSRQGGMHAWICKGQWEGSGFQAA